MSEAAPGYPDPPEYSGAARARLTVAVRALIDAVLTTPGATEDEIEQAIRATEAATGALTHRPGPTGAAASSRAPFQRSYLPRSPVIGDASPLAPGLSWQVADGTVTARGSFGAAYEGPPGFVHGGMIALAFDELLGLANFAAGSPGMTGTLTVRYRRPTPLLRDVVFTAGVEQVAGRRIVSVAELRVDDALCAEARGVFVQPGSGKLRAYFGSAPAASLAEAEAEAAEAAERGSVAE